MVTNKGEGKEELQPGPQARGFSVEYSKGSRKGEGPQPRGIVPLGEGDQPAGWGEEGPGIRRAGGGEDRGPPDLGRGEGPRAAMR